MIVRTYFLILAFLLSFSHSYAMDIHQNPSDNKDKSTKVLAILKGCSQNVGLYQFDGIAFKKVAGAKAVKNDTSFFEIPFQEDYDFYYVGTYDGQKKSILIGDEKEVILIGDCKNIRSAKVKNSPLNADYNNNMQQVQNFKNKQNALGRQLGSARNNPKQLSEIEKKFSALDKEKMDFVNKVSKKNAYLGKIIALESYQSYAGNKKNYKNEIDHFVNEYFKQTDLTDDAYSNIPYVFEAFSNYSKTLASINMDKKQITSAIGIHLQKIPADSRAYKYALGGTVTGLQGKNHPAFVDFGSAYVAKYSHEKMAHVQELSKAVNNAKSFNIGSEAPDFTQKTPEGADMSLSDLRGKVVLIDFWASWCGPCRKENPHVVKLYNKYKEKGFDVLGVSLDRTKDRWVQAIEKDKLAWNHVSDLKGWKNEVAATYSVRSIPSTVLLDKEGKIIARNFRAHELEAHLKNIFGE